MKLVGEYRMAADRLYRNAHVQKLFAADSKEPFAAWIEKRLEVAEPEISKAHDIRHLDKCRYCGLLGDRRRMPATGDGHNMHGLCAIAARGLEAVSRFPRDEVGKISLGEIGPTAMKFICDHVDPA